MFCGKSKKSEEYRTEYAPSSFEFRTPRTPSRNEKRQTMCGLRVAGGSYRAFNSIIHDSNLVILGLEG